MKTRYSDNLHVITGGPGSGKTSLLSFLSSQGHAVMPEAGRAVIRHQRHIGGNALPWADRELFAEMMLSWEMRSHDEAAAYAGPVFFDRGLPDVIGYLRVCGLEAPARMREAAGRFRYARRVFIAPPWREIYHTDEERKQPWQEAAATCRAMIQVYTELGYEIALLPLAPMEERAAFVMAGTM